MSTNVPGIHGWGNLSYLLLSDALGPSPLQGGGLRTPFLFGPKSAHMRFVHSRSDLGLCPKRHLLDSSRDLWGLIYLRESVPPRTVGLHMPHHILHHIA